MTEGNRTRVAGFTRDALPVLVLLAVLLPFVVYAVPELVGGDRSYIVLSGSMEPAISTGDVVLVSQVAPGAIGVGDVITFRRTGSDVAVTHRVVEVVQSDRGVAFRTKGDANEAADPGAVAAADVVGRVLLTIPYLGRVVLFIGSTTGFVLVIALPVGLLLLSELWRFGDGPESTAADSATAGGDGEFEWAAGATAGEASVDLPDGDESGFVVTETDLTLTSVALALLAAYSGWAAYESQTPLAIALAVGATTTLLLVLGVRQFGVGAESVETPAVSDGGTVTAARVGPAASAGVIPTVRIPDAHRDLPRVEVESLAGLSDLADRVSRPLVRDGDGGQYVVVLDDAMFVAAEPATTPHSAESADGELR